MNQAIMANIVAQIQASGGQPTTEAVRAQFAIYMHGVSLDVAVLRHVLICRSNRDSNSNKHRLKDKDKAKVKVKCSNRGHPNRAHRRDW